jgi:MscS family membrane protein
MNARRIGILVAVTLACSSARIASAEPPQSKGLSKVSDGLTPKLADFPRLVVGADHPLTEKLRSPRDTLQTLYYSIDVYDFFPTGIQDAVACLDLGDSMPPDSASAALLAVQLESVLNSLDLPLAGVTDKPTTDVVSLSDSDDIKIVMRKYTDGLWRFDRETVERIPAMRRSVLAKQKNLMAERAALKEGYTDPRSTIKRFWLDALTGDFTAASRALDLGGLTTSQRRELSSQLAQMLAFVLQRRGYTYTQLFSDNPTAPPFTWHADVDGRVVLQRVPTPDGKDAWLFSRLTVAQLPRMYAAAQNAQPDYRFQRLGLVVPPVSNETALAGTPRPAHVPERLGSPRMTLRTFFRAMDAAETNDSRIGDALDCLDLGAIPDQDRRGLGTTLAGKLEAILRALRLDLSAVPDSWDAATQALSDPRGIKVELVRQQDGCWRVSESTIARIPEMFEKLAAKERAGRERAGQYSSARDTTVSFLNSVGSKDLDAAAQCLDLSAYFPSSHDELGPVLAYKLKHILDRTARIYIQEVPDDPEGPRYALYRGEIGRVLLGRRGADPRKGDWQFTAETVKQIEPMFRRIMRQPVDASLRDAQELEKGPRFWDVPGVWLRLRLPDWMQTRVGALDGYQWAGLGIVFLVSGIGASILLGHLQGVVSFVLRKSGSVLTAKFVAMKLRPLTWLAWVWLFFRLLSVLDLPISALDDILAVKKFLLAGLVAWFGFGLIDLIMAIYSNSELLKPHRSLSDMVVPVSMRFFKGCTIVLVSTYIVYQIGQGELLGRFLTGLGVAGLAASLAAQDALKSFFGTLMLISERSFKIGDRIGIDNKTEGVVEQVGFRSTRLRTKEGSLVTIPNNTIASASINNFGAGVTAPQARAA